MTDDRAIRAVAQTAVLPVEDEESLVDTTIPAPSVGARDLLVEVHAVSVNPVDTKLRRGAEPLKSPRVLGYDAAGVVVEVGSEVTMFQPGEAVYYAGAIERQGSNAELQAVDERLVARTPRMLSLTEAAAIPLTALTAWESLFDKLRLDERSEGTLLVVGGAGGVGSMAVQLAKALLPGVRVIATASRPESQSWVRELGADEVIDHRGDLAVQVGRVAPSGIDWIFTTNVAGQLPVYEQILRPFGQVVAIDDHEQLDVAGLKSKSLSWHWENIFARPRYHTDDMVRQHEILATVAELVDAGRVRGTATTVLRPIDAATLRKAHAMVESGRTIGKVVVTNDPEAG